jgi:hypothetical protein
MKTHTPPKTQLSLEWHIVKRVPRPQLKATEKDTVKNRKYKTTYSQKITLFHPGIGQN